MIRKIAAVILLIALVLSFNANGYAEETEESTEEFTIEVEMEFTLEQAITTALAENLQWKLTNKELELQDLQNEIADDLNNDLRSAERNLRQSEEMLGESILAMQSEIAYVNGLSGTLGDNWADLTLRPISSTYISRLTGQLGSVDYVKAMSTSDFSGVLQTASSETSEAYFEIRTGKKQTIKEANATAAALMGLQSVRTLTMKQALDLINTAVDHGAALIAKADQDASSGIELMAENAFYEVLKAQKLVNLQTKAVNRAQEQYDTALKSFEQGLLSNGELEMALLQLNNMQINLHNAEIELNKVNLDFCVALGLPLDQRFTLVEPDWNLVDLNLQQGLEYAKTNRTDLVTAALALEMAELNLEYVAEEYRENTDEYQESLLYSQKKQLEYEQAWLAAETDIRKSYYDWQNAEYALEQTAANLTLVENQMNIAKISFDIGYSGGGESPLVGLLKAQEQVATLEQALAVAEFGRNLAWQKYLQEVGNYQVPVEDEAVEE